MLYTNPKSFGVLTRCSQGPGGALIKQNQGLTPSQVLALLRTWAAILGTHQDIVDPKFTIKKQTKEEKKKEIAT
jgi:hypothetical protein